MAIEKRRLKSGKFAYVVRVRRKDRAFFPTKSFQNKSDALEYEAKLRISKGDSGTSRRCQITFGRYVEVWWKKHNFEVSESWKISQRQMLRDYILPELDRLPLAKVDKHNFGGEGEIRTLETLLTPTRVPGVRIQPLCHLSAIENLEASVCSNLGPQSPLSNAI
jgi:hypothetical protein